MATPHEVQKVAAAGFCWPHAGQRFTNGTVANLGARVQMQLTSFQLPLAERGINDPL
jgi:hypothetical protein